MGILKPWMKVVGRRVVQPEKHFKEPGTSRQSATEALPLAKKVGKTEGTRAAVRHGHTKVPSLHSSSSEESPSGSSSYSSKVQPPVNDRGFWQRQTSNGWHDFDDSSSSGLTDAYLNNAMQCNLPDSVEKHGGYMIDFTTLTYRRADGTGKRWAVRGLVKDAIALPVFCPMHVAKEGSAWKRKRSAAQSNACPTHVANKRHKRNKGLSLSDVSEVAQAAVLEAFSGTGESHALHERRSSILQKMQNGCTSLQHIYWGSPVDYSLHSPCYDKLLPHQSAGVHWLLALHAKTAGMILADEMGLGKTATTLCFLEILASKLPSLVVAPATLLDNWLAESAKWTPQLRVLKYYNMKGTAMHETLQQSMQDPSSFELIVTTPGIVCSKDRGLRTLQFQYLICDEAHKFRNSQTVKHRLISKRVICNKRLLLTGTPVQNNLQELTTMLKFALKDTLSAQACRKMERLVEARCLKSLQTVQSIATPLILRRRKIDVLKLPKKRGVVVRCDMVGAQHCLYQKALLDGVRSGKLFHHLRRICLHPLLERRRLSDEQFEHFVLELIRNCPELQKMPIRRVRSLARQWNDFECHQAALEHGLSAEFRVSHEELLGATKARELLRILHEQVARGLKTLVFSQYMQLLDIIELLLQTTDVQYVRFDGSTAPEERQRLVDEFQMSTLPLAFLISAKCGDTGLNLTAANVVVMLDLDFNPQNHRQAEDRAHRLGQKREVTVYYLVCCSSVEELILKRCFQKVQLDKCFGAAEGALEQAVVAVDGANRVDGTVGVDGIDVSGKAMAQQLEAEAVAEFMQSLGREGR